MKVPIDFDGAQLATVELNRDRLLFTVRLFRRRRTYELPLSVVASIVCWKVTKAEVLECGRSRKPKRSRRPHQVDLEEAIAATKRRRR